MRMVAPQCSTKEAMVSKAAWWAAQVEEFKSAWAETDPEWAPWDRSVAGQAFHPVTKRRFCWYRDKKSGEIKWTRGWPGVPTK